MARPMAHLPPINGKEEKRMKLYAAIVATSLALASGAAFAMHCPADMKKIDEALAKNPKLTAAQMADVKKQRSEGEALHKAGKHQESVDTLAKAMKTLNIK
jgi:hypothetical protein